MLQLKNIYKDYPLGDGTSQKALKGVNINFRRHEFVALLGPSGCGKTTALNIIGGLDHYTSGDLIIDGVSTKNFSDRDWDNYRNKSIGFVFQSYNLIPHQNILNNVAMGLTLAGVKKSERMRRAKEALEKVGLGDCIKKRPNQLSGGQMQRVAIARAIVGDPEIILADEPTGALDSETGIQVMELLKQVSKDKLVIMVTHNAELANKYATRIVNMFDGELIADSKLYTDKALEKEEKRAKEKSDQNKNSKKKSAMTFRTAFGLSAKTLAVKKGRTILTSIAGSIGIFAITLILFISTGMNAYIKRTEKELLGSSAVSITKTAIKIDADSIGDTKKIDLQEYPTDTNEVFIYNEEMSGLIPMVNNDITQEFVDYVDEIDSDIILTKKYSYDSRIVALVNSASGVNWIDLNGSDASQMIEKIDLINESYDVLFKSTETGIPQNKNEVALVVDKYNRLPALTMSQFGFDITNNSFSYEDILNKEFKYIPNDVLYSHDAENERYVINTNFADMYNDSSNETLKIVGILRIKNDDATRWLSTGLVYTKGFVDYVFDNAMHSAVGVAQINNHERNVITGELFITDYQKTAEKKYLEALDQLCVNTIPSGIYLYPKDINSKNAIVDYLKSWNDLHPENNIYYTDYTEVAFSMLGQLIDVVSYILIAFCGISLIVSTVMISVTTYTSVVERTKEIGILRSLGARKKDISRIFNSETIIIGFLAGLLGVLLAIVSGLVINVLLSKFAGVENLANISISISTIMISLSVLLTWVAGLIPAKIAAKRDPVQCLRTE